MVRRLLLHAYCGSAGLGAIVTAPVLARSEGPASTRRLDRTDRQRCSARAVVANRRCAAVRRNRPAPVSARSTRGLADSKRAFWALGIRARLRCRVWAELACRLLLGVGGGDRSAPVGFGVRGAWRPEWAIPAARGVVWRGERGAARSRSAGRALRGLAALGLAHRASRNVIDSESWQSSNRRWTARGPRITTRSMFRVAAWLASSRTP